MDKMNNSYRREGTLSQLKRHTMPKHVLFYDTETYTDTMPNDKIHFRFKLGVAIYCTLRRDGTVKERQEIAFFSEHDFIDLCIELAGTKHQLYVFAHNQGFDLRVLDAFELFTQEGFESKPPILNNLVFIYGVKKGKTRIDFIDTSNLGVRSVEQLGLDMGFSKLKVDFNTVKIPELLCYCYRDVHILEKFVIEYLQYIAANKLGSFKVTLASQALTAFRTSFMNEDIYIHQLYGALQLERNSYYGGRTEAFYIGYAGLETWYYLDVNSMYPHAMTNYPLPNELKKLYIDPSVRHLEQSMQDFYCIAEVTLNTDKNAYPLRLTNKSTEYNHLKNPHNLPYPQLTSKRLIFPIGRFKTTLHYQELLYALERGHIEQVHCYATYTMSNPFDEYIKFFYGAKNQYGHEGNKTWRMISKLFLNSLYGKFGQLQPQRTHLGRNIAIQYGREPSKDETLEIFYQKLYWNYETYKEYKYGETAHSHPAIAGAITANARMTLYQMIQIASPDNVFYIDTDSLIVNQQGYDNLLHLIDSDRIGALDIEKIGRRLIIRGNKDYRLDDTKRHKGVTKSAKKIEPNKWEFLHFEGFITWWNNGASDVMQGEYRTKSRSGEYTKGIVTPTGRVLPFHLVE